MQSSKQTLQETIPDFEVREGEGEREVKDVIYYMYIIIFLF